MVTIELILYLLLIFVMVVKNNYQFLKHLLMNKHLDLIMHYLIIQDLYYLI
jgi:hypothetical protein